MRKYAFPVRRKSTTDAALTPTTSPDVEFCGYSIPHPSEAVLHLRIQTWGLSPPPVQEHCRTPTNKPQTASAPPKSFARASKISQTSATWSQTNSQPHGTSLMLHTLRAYQRAEAHESLLLFFEKTLGNFPCSRRYRVYFVHKMSAPSYGPDGKGKKRVLARRME